MISKDRFVEYINYIDNLIKKERKFNKDLSKCFGAQNVNSIFIFTDVIEKMRKMLCDLMKIDYRIDDVFDGGDIIGYFMYERDFGREPGSDKCISEFINDEEVFYDISSPEKLYDYIVSEQSKSV